MGKPRLLIIGPLPPPMGGVGAVVESILRSPLAQHWDVDVFNLSKPQQEGKPSVVTAWDVAWTLLHLVQLPWRLLTRRPDVVLSQATADTGYVRDLALMLECRALGIPVLLHWHGAPESPQFPGDGWRLRLFEIGVALASFVLVLAEPYRAHFEHFVPARKLVVLPNFVDGEVFRPSGAATPENPAVLFVGRVGPLKGVDVLLEALERARTCVPELTATLVGAGETDEALAAVRSHPLVTSGAVRLTGPLGPERVELYRKAQIVVLPTRMDSFPMVVLEAMAAGAAVVSTRVGAIPWMLDEGACGVLLPPGDAPALAEALVALARDPARCARLGAAARVRQQEHFDARGAATVLDRLLAQAAGG